MAAKRSFFSKFNRKWVGCSFLLSGSNLFSKIKKNKVKLVRLKINKTFMAAAVVPSYFVYCWSMERKEIVNVSHADFRSQREKCSVGVDRAA